MKTSMKDQIRPDVVKRVIYLYSIRQTVTDKVRANVEAMSTSQLEQLIFDTERYMRKNGIDYRTSQEKAAAELITDRQASYIRRLLVRCDTLQGFSGLVRGLVADPNKVDDLTKAQASEVIDSLTGNY